MFVKSQTLGDFPGGPEVKPSGFQWKDRILLTHTNILTYMYTYSYNSQTRYKLLLNHHSSKISEIFGIIYCMKLCAHLLKIPFS